MRPADDASSREKLEVLDGSRGREARSKAAVRIEDLVELLQLQPVKAEQVSAAPTAAQYNALLKDVQEVNKRLNVIATVLQNRLIG